ncbi:MAG: hypothetical protein AAB454_01415 [Patescibacteria group bacterium]
METENRKRTRFVATPVNESKPHLFEAEYIEIAEGVWQKIPGTEKDLGPINKT